MSTQAKAKIAADKTKGMVKEAAGKALGNRKMTAEGKSTQLKGDLRKVAVKVKEAAGEAAAKAKSAAKDAKSAGSH